MVKNYVQFLYWHMILNFTGFEFVSLLKIGYILITKDISI